LFGFRLLLLDGLLSDLGKSFLKVERFECAA